MEKQTLLFYAELSLALRLARAVREKGKDKVEGGEDDALCVICMGPPVDPIQVRVVRV